MDLVISLFFLVLMMPSYMKLWSSVLKEKREEKQRCGLLLIN
jgi:hypothetical protein